MMVSAAMRFASRFSVSAQWVIEGKGEKKNKPEKNRGNESCQYWRLCGIRVAERGKSSRSTRADTQIDDVCVCVCSMKAKVHAGVPCIRACIDSMVSN